jgi:hypothetical protein
MSAPRNADINGISAHDLALVDRIKPQFSPDGIYSGSGAFGETRVSRSTYEFIKRECLWSKEGLQRYAKAFQDGKKPLIVFPPDAMEVKAAWIDFDRLGEVVPEEKRKTYYSAEYQGKKYGLMTLHVITKDIPNWFWATFHHVDQMTGGFETEDTYGRPKILDGTVWANYKLGGTQVEFETSTGVPTILSDAHVERGFERSSCITCHATASVSPDGSRPVPNQFRAVCILTPNPPDFFGLNPAQCKQLIGERYFEPRTDQLIAERGSPLPEWYQKNGKLFFLPTDFLYSLPQRAQSETAAPPQRCIW